MDLKEMGICPRNPPWEKKRAPRGGRVVSLKGISRGSNNVVKPPNRIRLKLTTSALGTSHSRSRLALWSPEAKPNFWLALQGQHSIAQSALCKVSSWFLLCDFGAKNKSPWRPSRSHCGCYHNTMRADQNYYALLTEEATEHLSPGDF